MHYVPQILLILRFVKGVIRPCWQSVSEADSDAVIANGTVCIAWTSRCPCMPYIRKYVANDSRLFTNIKNGPRRVSSLMGNGAIHSNCKG